MNKEQLAYGKSDFSIVLLFVMIAVLGFSLAFLFMPLEYYPKETSNSFTITFQLPKHGSRAVERGATSKIEGVLSRIEGVTKVSSFTKDGQGEITIAYEKGIASDAMRFLVLSHVRQIFPSLPEGTSFPKLSSKKKDGDEHLLIKVYRVQCRFASAQILASVQELLTQLNRIQGVSKITVNLANETEEVLVEKPNLSLGLSKLVEQVPSTKAHLLGKQQVENGTLLPVVMESKAKSITETPLVYESKVLNISDLYFARVREKKRREYRRIDGEEVISIFVYAHRGVNQLTLSRNVEASVVGYNKILQPQVSIDEYYSSAGAIRNELSKNGMRIFLSLMALFITVSLIYRRYVPILVIVISLVCNIGILLFFCYFFKISINFYTIAAIAVSFGIITDNFIVTTDDALRGKNKRSIIAVVAATTTTIASLGVLVLLSTELADKLGQFSRVYILGLAISIFVALFFSPSLFCLFYPQNKPLSPVAANTRYKALEYWTIALTKRRWAWIALLVLAFGLPVHLVPEYIEGAGTYNSVFNDGNFKRKIRPILDASLGGSLGFFVRRSFNYTGSAKPTEKDIIVRIYQPKSFTKEPFDALIRKTEQHLLQYHDFEKVILWVQQEVYAEFKIILQKDAQAFEPYQHNIDLLRQYFVNFDGINWTVRNAYDPQEQNYNLISESGGTVFIELSGFNYEQLMGYCDKLRSKLLSLRRIEEVNITTRQTSLKPEHHVRSYAFNSYLNTLKDLSQSDIVASSSTLLGRERMIHGTKKISLLKHAPPSESAWRLNNGLITKGNVAKMKLGGVPVNELNTSSEIRKINQAYSVFLQFEYQGPGKFLNRDMEAVVTPFAETLPMGFKAELQSSDSRRKDDEQSKTWLLIMVVVCIIYAVCALLFESLKQPLAVLAVLPVSYIGCFLCFGLFKVRFDYGGYAALILTSGLSVNSAIYIIAEYNIKLHNNMLGDKRRLFIESLNNKITPVFLTVVSSVVGMSPFLVFGVDDLFWYSFAVGTIGGTVFSFVGAFTLLPLVFKFGKEKGMHPV